MAQLKILDTGFISTLSPRTSQTQLADSLRAGYTGTAVTSITLKNSACNLSSDSSIQDKPVINTLSDSKTSLVSVSNYNVSVNSIMQKSIVTTGYDKNNVIQLLRMERTKGLKILYPSSTGDALPTIVEALGYENKNGIFSSTSSSDDNGTVGTAVPYLIGRIKGMSVSDDSTGDYWRISFRFEVSG